MGALRIEEIRVDAALKATGTHADYIRMRRKQGLSNVSTLKELGDLANNIRASVDAIRGGDVNGMTTKKETKRMDDDQIFRVHYGLARLEHWSRCYAAALEGLLSYGSDSLEGAPEIAAEHADLGLRKLDALHSPDEAPDPEAGP